jgi:RNA polymerase sigma-70 factor (ECF subfamily)
LGARQWRCAIDPPEQIPPADARRGQGSVATADELASLFAATLATAASSTTGSTAPLPPDLGAKLVTLCQAAHQQYPRLAIDDRELVAVIASHAAQNLPSSKTKPKSSAPNPIEACLARCHAADLALAIMACRGVESAIAEIEHTYRLTIDSTCRRFAGGAHTAEDLKQLLRAKLFFADTPKLADYAGQGLLEDWLRVTAVRVFLDLGKRKKERGRDVDPTGDLVLDLVKSEHREAVATALHEAAQQLDPGDRHLLRQHVVADLSVDQLGAVLGIDPAIAATRIARARAQIVAFVRRELARRLALDPHELEDVVDRVTSRLDVSIKTLLTPVSR